jgi:hypothetical protein
MYDDSRPISIKGGIIFLTSPIGIMSRLLTVQFKCII